MRTGCAPTIRMLQWLLDQQYFPGYDTSSRWVVSITTISGVNNGATVPYLLGASTKTGELKKRTAGRVIAKLVETYSALAPKTLTDIYDFDLLHWGVRRQARERPSAFIKRLITGSPFCCSLRLITRLLLFSSPPQLPSFFASPVPPPHAIGLKATVCMGSSAESLFFVFS